MLWFIDIIRLLPMSKSTKRQSLKRLLNPKHIAVFGGSAAEKVIQQNIKMGYCGEIWPINPHRSEFFGIPCYSNIDQLPSAPDASFIGVPAQPTIEIIGKLQSIGSGGAICYASGFAELNQAGSLLQQQLLNTAEDIAIVGPNCHGLLNYLDRVALWPDEFGNAEYPMDKGVAIILQSGNIGINISMQDRSLPIATIITVGNKADLGIHDYIDCLLEDPRINAIGLYLENLTDISAFAESANLALQKKVPIVVLKSGKSKKGSQLTLSHTSSLAGEDSLYNALFDSLGIARVEHLSAFLETLKFVSIAVPLSDNRIITMSSSGAEAALAADYADQLGLQMPEFTAASKQQLSTILGLQVHITNPLDYHTYIWGNQAALTQCFTEVMTNNFNCTALLLDYPQPDLCSLDSWTITESALISAQQATGNCAVLVATIPENFPDFVRRRLISQGIAPMQGLMEFMLSVQAAVKIGRVQNSYQDSNKQQLLHLASQTEQPYNLDEWQSKQQLQSYGMTIPRGFVIDKQNINANIDYAIECAETIGFPVVVKALGANILHKTELGAVKLNLSSADAVKEAVLALQPISTQFLIEAMVTFDHRGRKREPIAELIIGIKRDPEFGLALIIGSGGILVELLRDQITLLLPLPSNKKAALKHIENAIQVLPIFKLIKGYRNQRGGDINALLEAILSVVNYATDNADRLLELDINPLMVFSADTDNSQHATVVAADALTCLSDNSEK